MTDAIVNIVWPLCIIVSFLGLIPFGFPLFMGIGIFWEMFTELLSVFKRTLSLKHYLRLLFREKENFFIIFPLCLLLTFALALPWRHAQKENAPKIDGYYGKITSITGNFAVHTRDGDETFTEAMISFGSGREEKAILNGYYKKGEIVLVARVGGGDYKNFTADEDYIWGTKIIPRPIPCL